MHFRGSLCYFTCSNVWLKHPTVPLCRVRQHRRRHQRVGLQGVVGKQGRGAHYKRRLNPEERQNILWGGEERGWGEGGERERRCLHDEDWFRGDFIPKPTTRLPLNNPESALVIIRRQHTVRGREERCPPSVSSCARRASVSRRTGTKCQLQHLRRGQLRSAPPPLRPEPRVTPNSSPPASHVNTSQVRKKSEHPLTERSATDGVLNMYQGHLQVRRQPLLQSNCGGSCEWTESGNVAHFVMHPSSCQGHCLIFMDGVGAIHGAIKQILLPPDCHARRGFKNTRRANFHFLPNRRLFCSSNGLGKNPKQAFINFTFLHVH